jgi:hypothetical protein
MNTRPKFTLFWVLAGFSLALSDPACLAQSSGKSPAQQAIEALSGSLHATIVKASGLGEISKKPTTSDSGMMRALDDKLSEFLSVKGENYHTFSIHGGTKVPVEISGLSLNGPHPQLLTHADRLNQIDARVLFTFKASGHRSYRSATGWTEWKQGKPILMSGITLERVNGQWKVTHSPSQYYSAR